MGIRLRADTGQKFAPGPVLVEPSRPARAREAPPPAAAGPQRGSPLAVAFSKLRGFFRRGKAGRDVSGDGTE
ncbi:MAG: hypothetical protein ABSH50_31400 [Bryobacteraceae bacterium]